MLKRKEDYLYNPADSRTKDFLRGDDRGVTMKRFDKRAGVTLIELLVVASIILSIMAISIPTIKPMLESRGTYNAANLVSTYLNRARTRAMVTGRPCGVFFEAYPGTSSSMILRQVEVPPLFTGYTEGATVDIVTDDTIANPRKDTYIKNVISAYLTDNGITNNNEKLRIAEKMYLQLDSSCFVVSFNEYIANPSGSSIRLDGSGPFYTVERKSSSDSEVDENGRPFWIVRATSGIIPTKKRGASFEIIPDSKPTLTAPVGLPKGTVVDLTFSSAPDSSKIYMYQSDYIDFNSNRIEDDANNCYTRAEFGIGGGLCLMFSPSGEVSTLSSRLFFNCDIYGAVDTTADYTTPFIPADTLYFLIGKWDQIPQLRLGDQSVPWNYSDGNNFWISINPTTGIISTTPVNTMVNPDNTYLNNNAYSDSDIERMRVYNSREFARELKRNYGGGR